MNSESLWQFVLARDNKHDGKFFYAVRTTGVYCRPSCPSRRPKREHVEFFRNTTEAEQAGYRPCRRCRPAEINSQLRSVQMACRYIEENAGDTLNLAAISRKVGISPHYLLRLFQRILGVTPRTYLDMRRFERFKARLRQAGSITDSIYEAGYGSSSRLYERSKRQLGMTPAEYRSQGEDASIAYTIVESPLGKILIGATAKGICSIRFGESEETLEKELQSEFSRALIRRDEETLKTFSQTVLRHLQGAEINLNLPLDIQATAFQRRVWELLQRIPYGQTRSYAQIAGALGRPAAARAVAQACAKNPVALAIPCHRVVRKNGSHGGYRWGIKRKKALLEIEQHR